MIMVYLIHTAAQFKPSRPHEKKKAIPLTVKFIFMALLNGITMRYVIKLNYKRRIK